VVFFNADWVNVTGFAITNSGSNPVDAGVNITNVGHCRVWDCVVEFNTYGILMSAAYECTIENCEVSNNTIDGTYLWDSSDNVIDQCDVMFNQGTGVYVEAGSGANNISANRVLGNDIGVRLDGSDGNTVADNDFEQNDYGVSASGSNGNDVVHNNFYGSITEHAFDNGANYWHDGHPAGGNYWDDWTGPDGNADGYVDAPRPIPGGVNQDDWPFAAPDGWDRLPPTSGSWYVTWDQSYFDQDIAFPGAMIIGSGSSVTLENVTLSAANVVVQPGATLKIRGSTLYVHNIVVHPTATLDTDPTEIYVDGNVYVNGTTIWDDTIVYVNCSFDGEYFIWVNSTGTLAIQNNSVVRANGSFAYEMIVIYLATFSVENSTIRDCGWSADSRGIQVSTDDALFYNATLTGNYDGVFLDGMAGGRMINSYIHNNTNAGIYAWGADFCTLEGNDVYDNGVGIWMESNSQFNDIMDNDVRRNYGVACGIYLVDSTENDVAGNNCSDNSNGIYLQSSYDNRINNNSCWNNNDSGIHLSGSWDNYVTGNNCSYNADGIYLTLSDWNYVANNTVFENDGGASGIHVDFSERCTVYNNTIDRGNDGLSFNNVFNSTVWMNRARLNSNYGFILANSLYLNIWDNVCNNNQYGMYLWNTSLSDVDQNNCSNNFWGIYVDQSHWNNVTFNTMLFNDQPDSGLDLDTAHNNSVRNNTINGNDGGVSVMWSDDNLFVNNTIAGNTGGGISISFSIRNLIYHNNIYANGGACYDDGVNAWDNGMPDGGNYIDGFLTPDDDADWIVDQPYAIAGGDAQDGFPWTKPFGWEGCVHNDDLMVTYGSIANAEAAASPGHSLAVKAGTYHGSVDISKRIHLYGGSPDHVFIDGGGAEWAVRFSADNSSIAGISVMNRGAGMGVYFDHADNGSVVDADLATCNYGLFVWMADDVKVENCTFRSNTQAGIVAVGSPRLILWNSTLQSNYAGLVLTDSPDSNVSYNTFLANSGSGLQLTSSPQSQFHGNHWALNGMALKFSGETGDLDIEMPASNLVNGRPVVYAYGLSSQTLPGGAAGLVVLAGCSDIDLQFQNVSHGAGIQLYGCSGIEVSNCNVTRSLPGMIILDSAWVNVTGSNFYYNDGPIQVENSTNVTVSGCSFWSGEVSLYFSEDANATVAGCTFYGGNGVFIRSELLCRVQSNVFNSAGAMVSIQGWGSKVIHGNTVLSGTGTINFGATSSNVVTANSWTLNVFPFSFSDRDPPYSLAQASYDQNITSTNTIAGRPIHYYYGQNSLAISDTQSALLILAYCSAVGVADMNMSGSQGIRVIGCDGVTIERADLNGSVLGMETRLSSNVVVDQCWMWNVVNGVTASAMSSAVEVANCNISASGSAVLVGGGTGINVHNNYLEAAGTGVGVSGTTTDVTIRANGIYGCSIGVDLEEVVDVELLDNTIASNGIGVRVSMCMLTTLTGNNIYDNSVLAVDGSESLMETVAATSNYWGDSGGPGANGTNDVSGSVAYDPWLGGPEPGYIPLRLTPLVNLTTAPSGQGYDVALGTPWMVNGTWSLDTNAAWLNLVGGNTLNGTAGSPGEYYVNLSFQDEYGVYSNVSYMLTVASVLTEPAVAADEQAPGEAPPDTAGRGAPGPTPLVGMTALIVMVLSLGAALLYLQHRHAAANAPKPMEAIVLNRPEGAVRGHAERYFASHPDKTLLVFADAASPEWQRMLSRFIEAGKLKQTGVVYVGMGADPELAAALEQANAELPYVVEREGGDAS